MILIATGMKREAKALARDGVTVVAGGTDPVFARGAGVGKGTPCATAGPTASSIATRIVVARPAMSLSARPLTFCTADSGRTTR